MMPNKLIKLLLILIILMSFMNQSFAHQGATGVVKERMDLMSAIGKDMKEVKKMLKGESAYDKEQMSLRILSIQKSAHKVNQLFPKGSLKHPSEAKRSIWKNWDEFTGITEKLIRDSTKLSQVAETDDKRKIMKQFVTVAKNCRSCHKSFREKK